MRTVCNAMYPRNLSYFSACISEDHIHERQSIMERQTNRRAIRKSVVHPSMDTHNSSWLAQPIASEREVTSAFPTSWEEIGYVMGVE
ncbi:hypothetical protein EVAR_58817_1 [Eumeta japonica]|uniref:Uncharacterized protein n=1 Tax=Eumeta variegata TaxID=151549 RepID=A0A4C1YL67_EUMVA|nr:hypothetical protein EVAR_58817_1 [Eumeta japonica]